MTRDVFHANCMCFYLAFRVVIRGDKEDNAVLCTKTQTFEIKEGEISNSMLIIPGLELGPSLQATGHPTVKYREVGCL